LIGFALCNSFFFSLLCTRSSSFVLSTKQSLPINVNKPDALTRTKPTRNGGASRLSSKTAVFDDLEERNEEEDRPFWLAILRNRGQPKCKERKICCYEQIFHARSPYMPLAGD
jgi:hypothetical protein